VNPISKAALIGVAVTLTACSALQADKVDYRSVTKAPALDVPPDLTQLSRDTRYTVVDGAVSASTFKSPQTTATSQTTIAALSLGDVRVERAGNQRWLVVKRPAEKLWDPIKDFWIENGFTLTLEQSGLGIMETDWNENRAKIPMDFVRNALGKLIDGLYSSNQRDKFRTRLERNTNGETEIFISYRGLTEDYTSKEKDSLAWVTRPADPEMEAEFLSRLMLKLGVSADQSKPLIAGAPATAKSAIVTIDGQQVVRMEEGFDRAWRKVGLALDRTGFTVEDRDRKQGFYFVRYVAPGSEGEEPGFFSKLFSSSNKTTDAAKYRISVRTQADVTTVSVLNEQGVADASASAQRIVKLIAEDIKSSG
jgi:outer membrane protein assembly factor BamC